MSVAMYDRADNTEPAGQDLAARSALTGGEGPYDQQTEFAGPETTGRNLVQSPRQLLVAIAVALIIIGWQTFRFPPEYLAAATVWCAVSTLAGLTCAAAAINPRRIYIATSGATVVCTTAARSLALVNEVIDRRGVAQAGYIVGAIAWALIALLSFVVWREYVLPWSITREARHRR